jgi:hypothetical protein
MITDGASSITLSLDQLASSVAGTFDLAFFELGTIRDTASEFSMQVERLLDSTESKPSDAEGEASYARFYAHTGRAAAAVEEAARSLADRKFQAALILVAETLCEIDKCAVELASISFLTKITQSETSAASEQVAVFVQTLDGRLAELKRSSAASSNLIAAIRRQSGLARDELATIAREFQSILRQGEARQERLADLEAAHHVHIGRIKTAATDLRTGVSQAVGGLVACLQFPDAFAQRVEHLNAATAWKPEEGEARPMAIVVSAQLDSLSRDLGTETEKALSALNKLSDTLEADTALSEEQGFDSSSAWVDANRRTNNGMLNAVASGREKLSNTLDLLKDLVKQIDRAQSNLEKSSHHNRALETSVFNALIVAGKSADTNTPLQFLTGHVKAVVGRSSHLIEQMSNALTRIRQTSEALERTDLDADLEELATIQGTLSARSVEIEQTVEEIAVAREALQTQSTRLTTSSAAAIQAFQAAADFAPSFAKIAAKTRSKFADGESPYADIPWLYASYTMEVERTVHREALGLPEIVEEASKDEDEFDDFLL